MKGFALPAAGAPASDRRPRPPGTAVAHGTAGRHRPEYRRRHYDPPARPAGKERERLVSVTREMRIGATAPRGADRPIRAVGAATGREMEPTFGGGAAEAKRACALAWAAFHSCRETAPEQRAAFLEAVARNTLDIGDEPLVRAMARSGLPRWRLAGGRGRTVGRLTATILMDEGDTEWTRATPRPRDGPAPPGPPCRAVPGANGKGLVSAVAPGAHSRHLSSGAPRRPRAQGPGGARRRRRISAASPARPA